MSFPGEGVPQNPTEEKLPTSTNELVPTDTEGAEKYSTFEVLPEDITYQIEFGNATIVRNEKGELFALRLVGGELWASEFTIMKGGEHSRVGAINKVHDLEQFDELRKTVEIKEFEQLPDDKRERLVAERDAKIESEKKIKQCEFQILIDLENADSFNYLGEKLRTMLAELTPDEQNALAERFFAEQITKRRDRLVGDDMKKIYEIYLKQKGSPFATKFAELEDARQHSEGAGGFRL